VEGCEALGFGFALHWLMTRVSSCAASMSQLCPVFDSELGLSTGTHRCINSTKIYWLRKSDSATSNWVWHHATWERRSTKLNRNTPIGLNLVRMSFEFARWWWSLLPDAPAVGVLDRQTYQGGTRGSRLCGGDRDRETENSKVCVRTRDTRFIQVWAVKVANPMSCLGDQVWRPVLRVGLFRCPARYPVILYIVQGAGS
jgi:hypothetical protein